jgi:hypothetical protein
MRDLKEIQLSMQPPMVQGDHNYGTVSDKIGDVTLKRRTPFHWFIGFGIAFMIAQALLFTVTVLLARGIGIWGNNQPSAGRSISSTSFGGSASDTRER